MTGEDARLPSQARTPVRERQLRHPQAEFGRLHEPTHLYLLFALHAADEDQQVKPLPTAPSRHALIVAAAGLIEFPIRVQCPGTPVNQVSCVSQRMASDPSARIAR